MKVRGAQTSPFGKGGSRGIFESPPFSKRGVRGDLNTANSYLWRASAPGEKDDAVTRGHEDTGRGAMSKTEPPPLTKGDRGGFRALTPRPLYPRPLPAS
jgi:hypothetical protein